MNNDLTPAIDPKAFRNALGHFATGVTIITGCTEDGENFGVTANSFNSVSLEPPLVLWSLGRNSSSFDRFVKAKYFCIHLLAEDQSDLSNHFAKAKGDKFTGIEFEPGLGNVPMLSGCAARFQCKTKDIHEGGDHLIFVGEVLEYKDTDKSGLMFYKGQYAVSAPLE